MTGQKETSLQMFASTQNSPARYLAPLLALLFSLSILPAARAQSFEELAPAREIACPTAWFQAAHAVASSGTVLLGSNDWELGTRADALTWVPEGLFWTIVGRNGGQTNVLVTLDVLESGSPISGVLGVSFLAAAYELTRESGTGIPIERHLHAAAIVWTSSRLLFVVVNNDHMMVAPILDDSFSPIPGVKGVAALTAQIVDRNPDPSVVDAALQAAAITYTGVRVLAIRFLPEATITTNVLDPVSEHITRTCGVLPLGGASPNDAVALLWTPLHMYLVRTANGVSTSEVRTPEDASVEQVWGLMRFGPEYVCCGFSRESAVALTPTRQLLIRMGPGGVTTQEVTRPDSSSLTTHVSVPISRVHLHQASLLYEVLAWFEPPGGPSLRGTVSGLKQ